MSYAVQPLVVSTLKAELEAYLKVLNSCPQMYFGKQPRLGHCVAWHALHIMDWTRCVIQPGLGGVNTALTYGYLGFENVAWAQAVTGPTLAQEQDDKEVITKAVQSVFRDAVEAVRTAPAERFTEDAMLAALNKPRPVLESLMYHARHTAYHRGQLALVLKELL